MKKVRYEILTGSTSGITHQLPIFLEASVDEMGIMVGFDGDIEQVEQFCNFTYIDGDPTPITPNISPTRTPSKTPSTSVPAPFITPSISLSSTIGTSATPSPSIFRTPSTTPTKSVSSTPMATQTPSLSISATRTPSLTPTTTPSITPSTSMIIYYKCADNGFHFNGYSDSLLGLLTVGAVHITTGTLTNYVIEWHLNSTSGSTVFITGNSGNTDPSIQAFHPLVSELVQAGTLYPVVRYANVNGVNYSSYSNLGYLYSPDLLTCLPSIIVTSMSCSNGATGTTWGHTVTYTNTTQPSQLANRSLTYTLNPDGSSTEIAYQFTGYLIADRVTVIYCTTGGTTTVINDWVVGTDCTGTTYNTTPKLYDEQYLKTTISLTGFTYQSGDYLLFNVYPSYNNPGYTDTNWRLEIKCFDTSNRLSSYWIPISTQVIDTGATMTFTYDSVNCQYVLTFNTDSGSTFNTIYYSNMYQYTLMTLYSSIVNGWESTGCTGSLPTYSGTSLSYYVNYNNDGSYNNYYPLFGQLNILISGTSTTHIVKYTFTDQTDYYDYKNSYTAMTQASHWTDYVADGNDMRHYKIYQRNFKISMTSGDTWTSDYLYLGYDAVFNFDDGGKIINITTAPMIVTYTGATCDRSAGTLHNYAQGGVNRIYSAYTQNYNTIWGTRNAFDYYYMPLINYTTTSGTFYTYVIVPNGTVGNGLNFNQPGWANDGTYFRFYKEYLLVMITNIADPLNNYKVYTFLDPVTGLYSSAKLLRSVP